MSMRIITMYIKTALLLVCGVILSFESFSKTPRVEDVYRVGTKFKYVKENFGGATDENGNIIASSSQESDMFECTITREEIINGDKYLVLSETYPLNYTGPYEDRCYLRIDGNKVYKHSKNVDLESAAHDYPIYDFDIRPDEIIKVGNDFESESTSVIFVKCVDRTMIERDGDEYERMWVYYVYKNGTILDVDEVVFPQSYGGPQGDYWIAGIGDWMSLIDTPNSKSRMFSIKCSLIQVENNGEVYFNSGKLPKPTNGIQEMDSFKENNQEVKVYNLNGVRTHNNENGIIIKEGKKYIIR